ncbi:TolB family protein [Thalassomonas sp. M1454]|uniref:TolB family protein n=1 Tax=Thalassomonas sp. M1454 TaxID=2594477 RepID=UPI00117ED24E|nr:hypothetical protein [Thalassomonas sp. M1454]TRX57121.1 hypothetical protein FNN08_06375 [Thalassomonas sp. M1454]
MIFSSKIKTSLKLISSAFLLGQSAASIAEDEIFLATLEQDKVVQVVNITNREGYDNQPHFTPDNKSLLYSAMFVDGDKAQTDSMRFEIATGKTINLTQSAASEYSPTVMPNGKEFSVIYVGGDGRQRFSSYPLSGGKAKSLVAKLDKNFADIGYHIWLNKSELLMFVLAQPMQLQRVNLASGKAEIIDTDIGRTLRKVPNKNLFSYNKANAQQWQMQLFDPITNKSQASVTLPQENMYYAWHTDGRLISATGAKLVVNTLQMGNAKWQDWHDFSAYCNGSITRLTMSSNSEYIAFVCNTTDKP